MIVNKNPRKDINCRNDNNGYIYQKYIPRQLYSMFSFKVRKYVDINHSSGDVHQNDDCVKNDESADKHEENTEKAISDIGYLLSRYFIGVLIEVAGVALINFLGLFFIARLGFNAAIGIAVLTGILNVIPYVGPFIGIVLGTILGLLLKYTSVSPIGLDVNFWIFTAILIAIYCFTQLVDNFLYQPLIYSTSIKSKPLEIFIVLLIVGHVGGPLAMIIAIPCYTVVRVIAFRFFGHIKAIKRLIPDEKLITKNND